MKTHLYLLIAFLLPVCAFSQYVDSTKANKSNQGELGFFFSPEYAYRTLNTDQNSSNQNSVSQRNGNEVDKFGYSAGIAWMINLNTHIGLSFGMAYSDKGYNATIAVPYPAGYNSMFYTGSNNSSYEKVTYHYNYLELPAEATYFFTTNKLRLFVMAGVSLNFNTSNYYTTESSSTITQQPNTGFYTFNPQVVAGFGLSGNTSPKTIFVLMPQFNYSIISITGSPIKEYLYSLGFNAGIYWIL
jgi:hypothetical protein